MLPGWPVGEGCGDDNVVTNIRGHPWGGDDFAVCSVLWFWFRAGDCTTVSWIMGEGRLHDALSAYFYITGI